MRGLVLAQMGLGWRGRVGGCLGDLGTRKGPVRRPLTLVRCWRLESCGEKLGVLGCRRSDLRV